MKMYMIFLICLIFSLTISSAYGQIGTYEVEVGHMFMDFYKIVDNKIEPEYEKAVDYAVEILKIKPRSLEESYILCSLNYIIDNKYKRFLLSKFNNYKDKYFDSIEDYGSNVVEKIILAYMLAKGFTSKHSDVGDQNEAEQNGVLGEKILLKMKDNISNENYAAIVLSLMAGPNINYGYEFKEKYPDHPDIYAIETGIAFEKYFITEEYKTYIDEIKGLIKKYKLKEVTTPFGYHRAINCYSEIISTYVKLNDYENAKIYLNLIKNEAPDYSELQSLEEEVEGVRTGVTKNERILKDIMEKNKNNNLLKK
ncbi:MAG: hypothetical protein PHR57_02850 [Patescibacteria group bacterium]|nr:hypothetical protein [Patescibacteria group bacterium]